MNPESVFWVVNLKYVIREMPQTDPTKKKNKQTREYVTTYQVLWFQWKHPSHWIPCCLGRTGCLHVIKFSLGSINNFCGGDVDAIKTISGVLKVDQRSMSFLASLCSFLYVG